MSIAVLIGRLLDQRPMTSPQMAAELGLEKDTVRAAMTRLRKATPKRAYIAAWTERGPTKPLPIWQMGDQADAPQPKAQTERQRNKRKWKALKADPSRYVDTQVRKRVEYIRRQQKTADVVRPAANPFAALFQ
jgi:predicted ArsR family transcriptional regulator